jgi:hypothetical protein
MAGKLLKISCALWMPPHLWRIVRTPHLHKAFRLHLTVPRLIFRNKIIIMVEKLNFILSLVVLITLIVMALFYRKMLPSYINEKAKNMATREDIAAITNEVEKVKMVLNIQGNLVQEERRVIMDINTKYFNWLNLLLDYHFFDVPQRDLEARLREHIALVEKSKFEAQNSRFNFQLFINHDTLNSSLDSLWKTTQSEIVSHINKCFKDLLHDLPEDDEQKMIKRRNHVRELETRRDAVLRNARIFQNDCRQYIYHDVQLA